MAHDPEERGPRRPPGSRHLLPHAQPGPREAVDLEINNHIAAHAERLIEEGWAREDALREAARAFGDVERTREEVRRADRWVRPEDWITASLDSLVGHLRFAARTFRRNPGFSIVAVLTLALGIGANTAIFSVVRGVLLKPLPYEDPDGLVSPILYFRDTGVLMPRGLYAFLKDESRTLERFGWIGNQREIPVNDSDPQQIRAAWASSGLFETLGVPPLMGRWPEADESNDVALLSYQLWSGRYGADPAILGQTIMANGRERTIVGVMPRSFFFPTPETPELWPAAPEPRYDAEAGLGGGGGRMRARLRAGVSPAVASTELTSLFQRLREQRPDAFVGSGWDQAYVLVKPLKGYLVGEDVMRTLWIVLGTVGFVLLIACANVANLFLVRAEARGPEMAVRTALGASRGRLGGHLLAESTLLAGAGALLGLWFAWVGVRVLLWLEPADLLRLDEVGIDRAVLAFTAGISLLAALFFGAITALRPVPSLISSLRGTGRRSTVGRSQFRARNLLVVSQVAFALVLLVGAGLMTRSFWHLLQVDPGFEPAGVLTFEIMTASRIYSVSETRVLRRQLLERMEALPGVERAGTSSYLPLTDPVARGGVTLGYLASERNWPDEPVPRQTMWVGPGYFSALGIPLLAGRTFEPADNEQQNDIAVVSASLAERLFPEEDPLGKRVSFPRGTEPVW